MDENTERLTDEAVEKIRDLIHLDIDAVMAYGEAISRIERPHDDIRAQLVAFQQDHERHIRELSQVLKEVGHEPPARRPDFKGYLIEGMTALRSALGTEQALKAMRQNELLTNRRYKDADHFPGLPTRVHEIVRRNRQDEEVHLDWITRALQGRVWQAAQPRI